jgi:hypothetical protein
LRAARRPRTRGPRTSPRPRQNLVAKHVAVGLRPATV